MENNVVILSGSRLGAENETQKKKQLSIKKKKKKKQISKPLLTKIIRVSSSYNTKLIISIYHVPHYTCGSKFAHQ